MPTASRSLSPSQSQRIFSWVLLIVANILWASSYAAAKLTLQAVSVSLMLALRMLFAAAILLPWLYIKRKELHFTRRDLPQLALLACVGFIFNKMLEFGGLALTTASDVALLITGESIFTAALSWLLLRERFRKRTVVALCIGFAGVYLIIERSFLPTIPAGGGALRVLGDLLVVMALLVEAFYTVRGKALLARHSPLLITAASIVGSAIFWGPVAGGTILLTGLPALSLTTWLWIIWLAVMCTVVAYLFWFQGLTHVDGSAAASTLFIQPLLGTFLAVILLHEQLSPFTVLGGLLIIASVYLISRQ